MERDIYNGRGYLQRTWDEEGHSWGPWREQEEQEKWWDQLEGRLLGLAEGLVEV